MRHDLTLLLSTFLLPICRFTTPLNYSSSCGHLAHILTRPQFGEAWVESCLTVLYCCKNGDARLREN